jgi:hypothetical protein
VSQFLEVQNKIIRGVEFCLRLKATGVRYVKRLIPVVGNRIRVGFE